MQKERKSALEVGLGGGGGAERGGGVHGLVIFVG